MRYRPQRQRFVSLQTALRVRRVEGVAGDGSAVGEPRPLCENRPETRALSTVPWALESHRVRFLSGT